MPLSIKLIRNNNLVIVELKCSKSLKSTSQNLYRYKDAYYYKCVCMDFNKKEAQNI